MSVTRFAALALVFVLAACSHCRHDERTDDHLKPASIEIVAHKVVAFPTQCWSLADWNSCALPSCNDNNECCSRERLGCTAHACGASGCAYTQDTADTACTCMPGECSPDGKSVCTCTRNAGAVDAGTPDSVVASAMVACPPAYPTCDPAKRTCVCDPAKKSCTPGGRGHTFCNADGAIETEACPESAPLCKDGNCICAANKGASCGCGGHVGCDGFCDRPTCTGGRTCQSGTCCDPKFGKPCDQCGGHYDCNGKCDGNAPPDLFQTCNRCGGKRQCGNACIPEEPKGLFGTCNPCGGTLQCDNSCLPAAPLHVTEPCGECNGTLQCDGSCSAPLKRCPVNYTPDSQGMCRSNLRHTVYSQNWSLGGSPVTDHCGTHCGCMMDESFDIAIACGPTGSANWTRSSASGGRVDGSTHASCDVSFATGDVGNCSVRVHFSTKAPFPLLCEHFICGVTVTAQDRIPQCSRR